MSITIPKNVRQMGEPEEKRKIYVEDYVVTYLRQYAKEEMQNPRAAMLLGSVQEQDGIPYLFIRSALELTECVGLDGVINFTDQMWLRAYEDMETYFQGQEILGWFLSTPGFAPEISYDLLNLHRSQFSGPHKILLLEDPTEGEEAFFSMEENLLVRQNGYFIFYERNEPMQRYMLEKKDGKSVDAQEDFSDRAARSFRMVIQEKKEENSQKRVMAFLYGVSTFLVMVVLVIGITMINNYEKMEQVEMALNTLTQNLEVQQGVAQAEESKEAEDPFEAVSQTALESEDLGKMAETQTDTDEIHETESQGEPVQEEPLSDEAGQEAPVQEETVEGEEQAAQEEQAQEAFAAIPDSYIVQEGDTLLSISRKIYGNDRHIEEICQLNNIDDSDVIFAGEKILLPQ